MSATAITSESKPRAPRKGMLLLLAAVFILPFVVGTGMFLLDWRPGKPGNYGELLQPPRQLPESGLHRPDGSALPTSDLRGKWLLVLPVSGPCDSTCERSLQQMRQVHIALSKDQGRLQRVLIASGGQADQSVWADLAQRFPDLVLAATSADTAMSPWTAALGGGAGSGIYLVDPFGNVMMGYNEGVDMRGVLKDLERLLKYSWVR